MKLLGHESMVTSQRYITAAGTETRSAAAQNTLYRLLNEAADIEWLQPGKCPPDMKVWQLANADLKSVAVQPLTEIMSTTTECCWCNGYFIR